MASVAAKKPAPRRRGYRLLIVFVIVIVIVAGALVGLQVAASAEVNAPGLVTVFQPLASVAAAGGGYRPVQTGAVVNPGDSVQTDVKGRASLTLPDGTVTQMAGGTEIKLDAAHFNKTGTIHDVTLVQQAGRTFTNVQHLVSGSSFNVKGKSATASVRGTKFEVYIKPDGTMVVKLYEGTMTITTAQGSVTFSAPQQVSVDDAGNITPPGPIQPDPNDPFGPEVQAINAVNGNTTPGTDQYYVGPPLHDGESQSFTYAYAGGSLLKASLGYPGSSMKLTVKAPDGQSYNATGSLPTVGISNAPGGIYTITITGVSGLGSVGEEPFVAVAVAEDCKSADVVKLGAVHRGYTAQDLIDTVQQGGFVPGLSNVKVDISDNTVFGAIIDGSGSYNGVPFTGIVVVLPNNGRLMVIPVAGTVLGSPVPARQVLDQIGSAIGQDPSNIYIGFKVERLFTCDSVLMIDGRVG